MLFNHHSYHTNAFSSCFGGSLTFFLSHRPVIINTIVIKIMYLYPFKISCLVYFDALHPRYAFLCEPRVLDLIGQSDLLTVYSSSNTYLINHRCANVCMNILVATKLSDLLHRVSLPRSIRFPDLYLSRSPLPCGLQFIVYRYASAALRYPF